MAPEANAFALAPVTSHLQSTVHPRRKSLAKDAMPAAMDEAAEEAVLSRRRNESPEETSASSQNDDEDQTESCVEHTDRTDGVSKGTSPSLDSWKSLSRSSKQGPQWQRSRTSTGSGVDHTQSPSASTEHSTIGSASATSPSASGAGEAHPGVGSGAETHPAAEGDRRAPAEDGVRPALDPSSAGPHAGKVLPSSQRTGGTAGANEREDTSSTAVEVRCHALTSSGRHHSKSGWYTDEVINPVDPDQPEAATSQSEVGFSEMHQLRCELPPVDGCFDMLTRMLYERPARTVMFVKKTKNEFSATAVLGEFMSMCHDICDCLEGRSYP